MVRNAIATHLGSHHVSRVLYGSIIGLALVLALEGHPPTAGVVAAGLAATGITVGLAELYSEFVGTETRTRARVGRPQMRAIVGESVAVALGCAFPAVFFLLAAFGVIGRDAAFDIAKWSGLGLIMAYGFAAARLTGHMLWGAVRRALIAGLIAGFLIVVKALLH